MKKEMRNSVKIQGKTKYLVFSNGASILNTASIIDRADVYFGASTGPTHIAGALGKRIVAIYPNKKTQSITRWGVFGNSNVEYIVPDENNPNEDYKNPYFDKFTEEMEDKAVFKILAPLEKLYTLSFPISLQNFSFLSSSDI